MEVKLKALIRPHYSHLSDVTGVLFVVGLEEKKGARYQNNLSNTK